MHDRMPDRDAGSFAGRMTKGPKPSVDGVTDAAPVSVSPTRHVHATDLRATAALASAATAGLVDLVEAVHERIGRWPGAAAPVKKGRTRGITGLVYGSVRGITQVVGTGADTLLGWLQPVLLGHTAALPTSEREAFIAALNGVLGDHLAATGNALATPLALRSNCKPLALETAALVQAFPVASRHVLVLIHGLCMNDLQWSRKGHHHGIALAAALGCTQLDLHYNSGLHISDNGAALAALLQQLHAAWPVPIERLTLLGHSMGGLVARSAIAQAQQTAQTRAMPWVGALQDLVCLGSPHHGAPLERAGRGLDLLLAATGYSAPFARLGQLRSAGITDLRHGNVQRSDWEGHARFEALGDGGDHRSPLPLPRGVRCLALAGSLGADTSDLKHTLLGDGLVPVDSALGRHANADMALTFEPRHQWLGQGLSHLDLLSSAAAASWMVERLRAA